MLRAIHSSLNPVKPGHALMVALAACSCAAPPYDPVSSGCSGYLSDRAWEIVADFSGNTHVTQEHGLADLQWRKSVDRDVAIAMDSFAREGKPLFAPRARIDWQLDPPGATPTPGIVRWKARVHSLALPGEVPAGFDPSSSSDARIRFASAPEGARQASPELGKLTEDGELRVGALFGQMNQPWAETDDGLWSREVFEQDLASRGYEVVGESPLRRTWKKGFLALNVLIDVSGPDAFRLDGDLDESRSALRELIARHEVVYLNAHANQVPLAVLADPTTWDPPGYRVVMLDVCWSYFLYARQALDAAGWNDTHLVVASGRVVTGSVESFAMLLHGITDEMAAEVSAGGERRQWLSWITQMNELADARARERAGKVTAEYASAEVYGVSGLWRP